MGVSDYFACKPEDAVVTVVAQEQHSVNSLSLTLEGLTWPGVEDIDGATIPKTENGRLTLLLEGVKENTIAVGRESRSLNLSFEHPILWNWGATSSIFGNAPLPDPPKFYFDFHNMVSFTLAIPRDPNTYLNFSRNLDEWLQFVYSRTYQLLRAPSVVAKAATELLDAQAADFTLLPDEAQEYPNVAVLLVGDMWIVFEKGGAVQKPK